MPRAASVTVPTWPPTVAAYNYILTLNEEEIAWEGLRRNPDYQRHYLLHRAAHGRPHRLPSGQSIWRVPISSSAATDRWRLRSFRRSGLGRAGSSHLLVCARWAHCHAERSCEAAGPRGAGRLRAV